MLRLASSSPRRIQLLRLLLIPFESTAANVDEPSVVAPARAKAEALARSGEVTLAADTEIELDGERARIAVGGSLPIVAEVSASAVRDLDLRERAEVWVSVKAAEVGVYPA